MVSVLVVDDSPEDREFVVAACARAGAQTAIASSAKEANALMGSAMGPGDEFVAVFLDLVMPGGPGLEFLADLRRAEIQVPVIVLSESDRRADVYAAYRMGANAYVIKDPSRVQFGADVDTAAHFWIRLNQLPPSNLDDLSADKVRGSRERRPLRGQKIK